MGRYVFVGIPGNGKILTLCEVEVKPVFTDIDTAYLQVEYACIAETESQASIRTENFIRVTNSSGQSASVPVDITSIVHHTADKLRSVSGFMLQPNPCFATQVP